MSPEPKSDPVSPRPSRERKRAVLARVSIEEQARDIAEERLTDRKNAPEQKGMRGFFRRMWKQNLAYEYYRQKEIAKAKQEIVSSGNLYAGESVDRASHDEAMTAIVDRFASEYEDEMMLRAGERRRVIGHEGEDSSLQEDIRGLIRRFATDEITEDEFHTEKKSLLRGVDDDKNSLHADNLLEIAREAKDAVGHGTGIEEVIEDLDIVVGHARAGVETEARYTAVDRITEKIRSHTAGRFVNEATVASAVALFHGILVKGATGVLRGSARLVGPLGTVLSGGIGGAIAGIREKARLKGERAQHAREMAKGKRIDQGSKRREELEVSRHETVPASELTQSIREALHRLEEESAVSPDVLLESLTATEARLSYSEREKIDLIGFSGTDAVERERTELIVAVAEAKTYLKRNTDRFGDRFSEEKGGVDGYLRTAREAKITETFAKEKAKKDEIFNKMKRKKVATAVMKGTALGVGIGLIAQETATLWSGNRGLFGGGASDGETARYTLLGSLRRLFPGSDSTPETAAETAVPADVSEAAEETVQPKMITKETILETQDYVESREDLFTKIRRGIWADNDTTLPDRNELRLDWGGERNTGIDADGNIVFSVKRMIEGGSFHGDTRFDPLALAKEGKMKLLLSLSGDTQNQVVEIPIDASGNAVIDPESEIGRLAFSTGSDQATFLGKFAEVAVEGETVNGTTSVSVLATHVGQGVDSVTAIVSEEVPVEESVPIPASPTPEEVIADNSGYEIETPPIIPLWLRKPLEKAKNVSRRSKRQPLDPVVPPKVQKSPEPQTNDDPSKRKTDIHEPPAIPPVISPEPKQGGGDDPETLSEPSLTGPGAPEGYVETDSARAAAWHTLYQLVESDDFTFEDLNGADPAERNRKFVELTRKLWKKFAVHEKADLDAYSWLYLLEKAGMPVDTSDLKKMSNVSFVPQGEYAQEGVTGDSGMKEGISAGDGGKWLVGDHHAPWSERGSSATKFLYELLIDLGFLEKTGAMDRFVELVTKWDNADFSSDERKQVLPNYWRSLYGLSYRMHPKDVFELLERGQDPSEPLSEEYLKSHTCLVDKWSKQTEQSLFELSAHMKQQMYRGRVGIRTLEDRTYGGFTFDTGEERFGKILIDTGKLYQKGKHYNRIPGENNSNQLQVFEKGYGAYLIWSPEQESFVLFTEKKMEDDLLPQGINVRGHMWLKPKVDKSDLTITLENILTKLAGKNVVIKNDAPKLHEALITNRASKDMLALLDEGKLTEDILRDAASERRISLSRLLKDMLSQRGQLEKVYRNRFGALKPDEISQPGVAESLAIEILLSQKTTGDNSAS